MILPQTYIQTLVLLVASLLFLGSWPVLLKKAGQWRFELFALDFAIGMFLAAVLYANTVGTIGSDGFSFGDDIMHARKVQWVIGFGAGVVFNFGVMLFLGALSVAGIAVASTVAFSLSLILGVGLPQLMRRSQSSVYLFLAFTLMVIAIVCAAMVHSSEMEARAQVLARQAEAARKKLMGLPTAVKGILLSVTAGLMFALYYPFSLRSREGEIGLGPYSCMFLVGLGVLFSAPLLFAFFINLPVEGEPLGIGACFKGPVSKRVLGWLAGILCCTGLLIPIVAAAADPAAQAPREVTFPLAMAVPLLSAVWGLVFLKEMPANPRARFLAVLMLLLLAAGVALVALAPSGLKAT